MRFDGVQTAQVAAGPMILVEAKLDFLLSLIRKHAAVMLEPCFAWQMAAP